MSSNYRHSSLDRERIMKSLAGEFFKTGTKGSWDTLKLISSGEFIAPGVWADQERQDSLDPEKVRANRNLWRSIDSAFDSFSEPFGPKDAHRIITYWTHLSGACSDPQGWVRRGDISFRPTEEDRRKEIPGYRAWKQAAAKKNPAPVVVAAIIQAFLPLIMSLGTKQINAYKKANTEDQIKMLKKWSMFLSPPVRLALQHKKSARNIATKLSALLNDPETMDNLKEAGKAGIEVGQAYRGAKGKTQMRKITAKKNTREVNPYSRRYTLASFTKKYFPGERVSPGVAKSFWDDFRFGYQGGLSRYIKETTWVDGEQLAKKNPKKGGWWLGRPIFSEEELRSEIDDLEEKLADSDRLEWSHELEDWLADTRSDLADLRRELKWQEAKKGLREGKLVGTSIPLRDYADVYPRDLLKRLKAKKNPTKAASRRAKGRRGKEKFVKLDVGHPDWSRGWTEEFEVKATSVAEAKKKARAQGYIVRYAEDHGMMMRHIDKLEKERQLAYAQAGLDLTDANVRKEAREQGWEQFPTKEKFGLALLAKKNPTKAASRRAKSRRGGGLRWVNLVVEHPKDPWGNRVAETFLASSVADAKRIAEEEGYIVFSGRQVESWPATNLTKQEKETGQPTRRLAKKNPRRQRKARKNAYFWHPPQPPRPPRPEPRWIAQGHWIAPEDVKGANMTIYEDLSESAEPDYSTPGRDASYAQTVTPYNPNDRDGWARFPPRYSEEGYNLLVREPTGSYRNGPWTVYIDLDGDGYGEEVDTGRGPWDDWEDAAIDAERWADSLDWAKKGKPVMSESPDTLLDPPYPSRLSKRNPYSKARRRKRSGRKPRLARKNGPTLGKPHYPFAEKEKQYAKYTTEALYDSMNDAIAASRAQQGWNEAGANWYLDDYHTIVKEIQRRKRRG
jgi:hypothetical protein